MERSSARVSLGILSLTLAALAGCGNAVRDGLSEGLTVGFRDGLSEVIVQLFTAATGAN
jgi:hypothetical protein